MQVPEPRPDSPEFAHWLRRTLTPEDFKALPADDVEALRRFGTSQVYPPGTTLFRQGGEPEAIHLIERGEVELVCETRFERLIVQILGAGSMVGDIAVMLETTYPYAAVTRAETTTLRFGVETMRALIEIHPEICFRWLRLLARRLDRAHRRVVELAGRSAREQIAHFLLHEAEQRRSLTIELVQKDVAEALSLSRQTVSRMLGQLERQRLIECRRGRIRILDFPGLRKQLPQ